QAEADAEVRLARADRFDHGSAERLVGGERARRVAERALGGDHYARGGAHTLRLGDQAPALAAPGLERAHHRAQVAEARVDHRDHSFKVPFVEGTPLTRGSTRAASEVARANDFHSASRMWCAFSP